MLMKRTRAEAPLSGFAQTPTKRARLADSEDELDAEPIQTPSKRSMRNAPASSHPRSAEDYMDEEAEGVANLSRKGSAKAANSQKRDARSITLPNGTPTRKRGPGRPRKNVVTTRGPKNRELAGELSDEDELGLRSGDEDEEDMESDIEERFADKENNGAGATKSVRGRGRSGGSGRRKRTPTPPPDMPPYEQYFFQNRPGGLKTSNNTLSSMSLLTHEEYYNAMRTYSDPHQDEMDYLHHLHSRSFDQWLFELEEGFSLCLYGWGSKRLLLSSFADYIASSSEERPPPRIIIINGYNPSLTIRDLFSTVATLIPSLRSTKLGATPADMLSNILSSLSDPLYTQPIHLLIHSIDSPALRRYGTQSLLARLAQHPLIRTASTADTPTFPLLWDARLRSQLNLLFHDATTFQPFSTEISIGNGGGGVVDEVNALLGRSGRRVHGREGVVFVLRSLTESARRLFGLLVSEVLSLDAEIPATNGHGHDEEANDDDDDFEQALSGTKKNLGQVTQSQGELGGVEYRALYRKAVQQLITGNEVSFRQLLKEFYDHQMVVSRRDGMGTEVLGVPFRREECEAILEDLVVDT